MLMQALRIALLAAVVISPRDTTGVDEATEVLSKKTEQSDAAE